VLCAGACMGARLVDSCTDVFVDIGRRCVSLVSCPGNVIVFFCFCSSLMLDS